MHSICAWSCFVEQSYRIISAMFLELYHKHQAFDMVTQGCWSDQKSAEKYFICINLCYYNHNKDNYVQI